MKWKTERYPQDQQWTADHRIMDGDKVIAFCPTGYPFSNVELMAMAPTLLRVARAAKKLKDEYDPYETMSVIGGISALFEALKELPDGLLEVE